jgi:hypothetical protein
MTLEIKAIVAVITAAILAGMIGWFALHERKAEHAKDAAADAKAVQVQAKKDDAIVASDTEIVKKEAFDYAKSLDTPVTRAPVVSVCVDAPHPVQPTAEAKAGPSPDAAAIVRAAAAPVPPVEREWDTRTVLQIAHDADAQVKGLQDYINRVCPSL